MNGIDIIKIIESNSLGITCNIKASDIIKDIDFISDEVVLESSSNTHTLFLVPSEKKSIVRGGQFMMAVGEESSLLKFFHLSHNKLKKELTAEKAYTELLKSMYTGGSIQNVLNEYARANDHFIVVLDVSGRILANSSPVIDSPVWQEAVNKGFCDFDFMEHIRERSKKSRAGSLDIPSIYYCKSKALYYLSNRIHVGNLHVGNVFIIKKTEDFLDNDYDIITTISRIFSDIILKEKHTSDVSSYLYGGILGDLLSGMPSSQTAARIKTSGLKFPSNMRVIFLCPLHYLGDKYVDNTLLPALKTYISTFPYLVIGEGLAIVADVKKIREDGLKEKFDDFCTKQHLIAGVSDCFTDIIAFPEYYEQARSVIALGKKLNRNSSVLMFRDWAFYLMIESVDNKNLLKDFAHPALAILRNYDENKNTNLFETLKAFIKVGFSPTEAADSLYLHRNTFNYRRKKIEELCDISLEDQSTRFQLACSYQIFDYLDNASA